jgi:hypothetical protein
MFFVIGFSYDSTVAETPEIPETEMSDEQEVETEEPELTEEEIEKQYKKSCKDIDYKKLLRHPDKYKGENIHVVGVVSDVYDDTTDGVGCEITTAEEYGVGTDEMWVLIPFQSDGGRYLEGDKVEIWGEFKGMVDNTDFLISSADGLYLKGRYAKLLKKSE